MHICKEKIHVGHADFLWWFLKYRPRKLRTSEIIWLKSGKIEEPKMKNQFRHSNSASNADEK